MPRKDDISPPPVPALFDRDGYPPCVMTLEQFIAHLREAFGSPDFRIVAFRVRGYCPGGTITSSRGTLSGRGANRVQRAAVEKELQV